MLFPYIKEYPLLKDFGLYAFSSFLSKAISLAFLPIFTNYIAPSGYGIISLYFTSIYFISPLINFSLLNTLSSDYFLLDRKKYSTQVSTLLIIPVSSCIILSLIVYFFKDYLADSFSADPLFLLFIPIVGLSNFFFELALIILRNKGKALLYSLISIVKVVLELSLSFILIISLDLEFKGRLISTIVVGLITLLVVILFLFKTKLLTRKTDPSLLVPELKYSFPVILNQVSVIVLIGADKFFINRLVSKDVLGSYSVASQIGFIVFTFSGAYIGAFHPFLFKTLSNPFPGYKKMLARKIYESIFLIAIICAIVLIAAPLLYKFFINSRYAEGIVYIKYIILAYFFWSVQWILFGFLNFYKLKRLMLGLSILITITIVSLNYALAPIYGIYGVLFALILTCFGAMVYIFFFLKYKYELF